MLQMCVKASKIETQNETTREVRKLLFQMSYTFIALFPY